MGFSTRFMFAFSFPFNRRTFECPNSVLAVSALLSPANASIVQWFRVRRDEMPALAFRADDALSDRCFGVVAHLPRLRCSSAKLTRDCLLAARLSAPGNATPCIEAATAQPTTQSNQ